MEELAQRLVLWIREKVIFAGARGVVVGMSGGVDSSVVAVLGKRAFPNNILGLILPCFNAKKDIEDAQKVASLFSIPTHIIVLDKIYEMLKEILPQEGVSPEVQRLALGNIKPRLRMLVLYYFANRLNYLVLGTGNKSELTVGYFTKYGDGGVDLLPLGNLVKSEVRRLALHLGIPEEIVYKVPSAGLWEGQTDEGEMGLTYEELDRYILTGEATVQIKEKIEAMKASSQHKRMPPPIPVF